MQGNTEKNKNVQILHWNADSFLLKKEEVKEWIKNINVFLIRQTKMIEKGKTPEITVDDFKKEQRAEI